ncbi:hypothetical protein [Azospirillum halopraeferens]|uniref:hypothetical protein n=1 Tax=Azospirillum halopraeferens TaxID=34010 RepID=UPI0004020FA9|nr:hypothetical protein [Azospirillum halopraeferens]
MQFRTPTLTAAAGLVAAFVLTGGAFPASAATGPAPVNPPPACATATDTTVNVGGTTVCGLSTTVGTTVINSYQGIPYATAGRWQAPTVAAVPANYRATQPMWLCP